MAFLSQAGSGVPLRAPGIPASAFAPSGSRTVSTCARKRERGRGTREDI